MTFRSHLACLVFLAVTGATSAQSANLPEILYLSFNEGTGTTTMDRAMPGVGSAPTIANAGYWVTSSPLVGSGSIDGSAATLPLSTVCNSNGSYFLNGPWTVEAVIRRSGAPSPNQVSSTIFSSGMSSLIFFFFTLSLSSTNPNDVQCMVGQTPGTTYGLTIPQGALLGITTHLAITYDPSTSTLAAYKDGVFVNSTSTFTTVTLAAGSTGAAIGAGAPSLTGTSFPGAVDEVRVWSRLRTPTELSNFAFVELMPTPQSVGMLRFAEPLPILSLATPPSFFVAATVASATLGSGLTVDSPSFDPLIGSFVTISGSYGGNDTTMLSDILFAPCVVRAVSVPGTDELMITTLQQATSGVGDDWTFESPTSARPIAVRDVGQASPPLTQRLGAGSLLLDGIENQTNAGARISLLVEITPSGNRVRGVAWDYVLPTPAPEARLRQLGLGGVQIGLVDIAPGSEIWNLFALNSPIGVGTGPLFGLEFGAFQLEQIALPLATAPFHVNATANGIYGFSLPFPIVSPGTAIDMLSVTVNPGGTTIGFIAPIQRIVF